MIISKDSFCILLPLLLLHLCGGAASTKQTKVFTNHFAVNCIDESEAKRIAQKHGFSFLGQIGDLEDHFLLESPHVHKRSVEENAHHVKKLTDEDAILWVEQQHVKRRVKRDYAEEELPLEQSTNNNTKRAVRQQKSAPRDFTDVLYYKQWYLHHGAKDNNDMNIIPAWKRGYSGKNVVVSILDDGIQTDHPDLVDNYDPKASYDINDNDENPMPRNNNDNKHGTRCAGEVASMAFNDYCGVGIAYNAKIGGVRMLDGSVTDAVEARALGHNPQHIDIYSASWGPEDNGATVDGPGKLAKLSFLNGILKGRNGKGSIYVWASGNGGRYSDNCNCDGYTNSIFTLSISSATQKNLKPWYLEQCSSTLATTYSSGQPAFDPNVVTVDMDRTYLQDQKAGRPGNPRKLCTEGHTGTSASAPMAAGICALAVEANPHLTWRDMQHIVVMSSRYEPLADVEGWITNGVKRKVSHKFGYGLMDGGKMVNLAETWKSVPPQRKCDSPEDNTQRIIPTTYHGIIQTSIHSDGCRNSYSHIRYLEHVQATITLNFKPRGNLLIKLVSPMGTHSTLLFPRPHDMNDESFTNWPFLSVHYWGENPVGNWTLTVLNAGVSMANAPGILRKWSLTMYGTYENPLESSSNNTGACDKQCLQGCYGSGPDQCYLCKNYEMESLPRTCVDSCPRKYYVENRTCKPCHSSCESCFGPHANDCQSCKRQHYLKVDEMSCVLACPVGFFQNEELRICVRCESQCKSCSKSPHHCDDCADNLVMVRDHECDSNCPSHSYHSTKSNRCEKCSSECKECIGPGSNQCLSCFFEKFLNVSSCVTQCGNNTVAIGNDNICYSCNPLCKTCSRENTCDSCVAGYSLSHSECSPVDGCISEGCQCPEQCSSCTETPELKCTSCQSPFYLAEGRCLASCPDGYFHGGQRVCWPCFDQCQQCKGSKVDQCTSCHNDFVLHEGKCLPVCPQGFFKARGGICQRCNSSCKTCISENDCISCPQNKFYLSRKCVTNCPIGYHNTGTRLCIKCHHSCASCAADGAFACQSCNNGVLTDKGNCVPCSYNQYFNSVRKICSVCHQSCKTCFGPNEDNCNSCVLPLQFDPLKQRCVNCCPKNSYPTKSCCYCDQYTGLCSSTTPGFTLGISLQRGQTTSKYNSTKMFHLQWLSVAFCVGAILLFFIIFAFLQFFSQKPASHDYEPVSQRSDNVIEKVALTSEDLEDDEAFVHS